MAEFIEFLSKDALAELQIANKELVTMVANVDKVGQKMKNISSPSGSTNAIKDLSAEYQRQEKVIQSLQQKLEQISKSKQTLNKRTSEEIVNQRALAQASDRQARATSALVGAYANLNAKHQQAKKTLQDLIASQTASNSQIRKAQKEYDALDKRVVAANNAVRQFNYNVGNYPKQAFNGIKNLMSAFGVFGGIYLFAGAVTNAFQTVKEFDKANADLAATMGKSRKEISSLTEDQKRLGAITKFTATEVAGLQKEFAKLGFTQTEILNATEATLSLAAAVETDLANASMVAGSTLRGFGLDASEMQRVVDVMAKSFTSSALDIENFRESMKYVAPIAKASGVSIEFTTAMLGKLADAGIKGSQAGTSLRRILAEMAKTGKPASEALDAVAKSGISVNDAMDEVGRTAQTALLVLSKSKTGIDELANSLNNAAGAAKAMADEQLESLQGKITLLTSAWDGFILSLEDGSGSGGRALGYLVDKVTELLNKMSALEALSDKTGKYFFDNWKQGVSKLVPKETLDAVDYFNRELEKTDKIAKSQLESIRRYEENIKKLGPKNFFNSDVIATEQKLLEEATKKYNATLKAQEFLQTSIKEKEAERLKLESEFITAFTLRNKQVSESVALSYAQQKTDAQLKREIGLLTLQADENTKATGKNTKAKKENEKAQKDVRFAILGSVEWFEKLKRALEEEQKQLSQSNPKWKEYQEKIDQVQKSIEKITKGVSGLDGVSLNLGGVEFLTDEEGDLIMEEGNKLRAWLKDFRKEFQDDFWQESGFGEIQFILDNWDNLKESGTDTALAISEAFQQAFNTIAQSSNANFQQMYSNLEQQRDVAILFAGESATAREEIERQYEERRKRIQRQQAEAQKRLAIFNIVTNTAQAVVAALPNIPLSLIIAGIGAANLALTASQPIPAFEKGGVHDGGLMLVNDGKGSNYRETIVTPDGKVVKPQGKNVVMNAPKGTQIFTHDQWQDRLNNLLLSNGIEQSNSRTEVNPIINVETKDNYHFEVNEKGFKTFVTRGQAKTEILNARFRQQKRYV